MKGLMKKTTLYLLIPLVFGLASCDQTPETDYAKTAIEVDALVMQGNGRSLELGSENDRSIVNQNLLLAPQVLMVDEEDNDFYVNYTWETSTPNNWNLKLYEDGVSGVTTDPVIVATPLLPDFGTQDIPTTLTVTATYEGKSHSKTYYITIPVDLVDESTIPLAPLNAAISAYPTNKVVRVRGYITGIMTDWNTIYIAEGNYGIEAYRVDLTNWMGLISIGDYVQITGQWSSFNGARQLSFISRIKFIAPASVNAADPVYNVVLPGEFTADKLAQKDGALVELNNLVFDPDKGDALPPAGQPYPVGKHITIYAKDSEGKSIRIYVNYRIGNPKQTAIVDLIRQAVDGKTFNFKGNLAWHNDPQLLPLEASNITLNS